MARLTFLAGSIFAVAVRALMPRLILIKLRRDVRQMNAGDYKPVLSAFADDAVLVFNNADHRFAGEHRGKAAIETFLQNFVGAGLQGEIREIFIAGPPWRMTMLARFDDSADAPDGTPIYKNRTVLLVRARWGRIVHQEDFYEDTERIVAFEAALRDRGIMPVA
jgi:ketosteroid isomerase-like protein